MTGKAGDCRSEDSRPAVVGDPGHPAQGGAGVRAGGGGGQGGGRYFQGAGWSSLAGCLDLESIIFIRSKSGGLEVKSNSPEAGARREHIGWS